MKLNALTDVGKVRENNEDCFALVQLEDAAFLAVFDGMGGVNGGEIASDIAATSMKEQIELSYSAKMKPAAIERMLISAFTAANLKIFNYATEHDMVGMGTTAVAAIVKDGSVTIAYDGDSRAYCIGDQIKQITTDHTYLNELLRMGKITEEEMLNDSRKNIITRALGVSSEIDVEIVSCDLEPGQMLLLCSDGLTNCLNDAQILEICKTQDFDDIPGVLIQKANENGGIDNITVAVLCEEEGK